MPKKEKILLRIIYETKLKINEVILWISIKLGLVKAILIVPYQGFGNLEKIFLVGRVIKDNRIKKSTAEDSVWQNIEKMIRRFWTVVIPNVTVKAVFHGKEYFAITNEEGYFEFNIDYSPSEKIISRWQSVELTLMNQVVKRQGTVKATGEIFIPFGQIDYGVISDIDDTIIPTGAIRLTEMLKTTFAKNVHTRVPFAGVSAFYKALEKGKDGIESNPFFYVSSSPWNLYDFLMELLEVHHIPKGPLMLRDIGLSRTELISGSHQEHKLKQIRNIISTYPNLTFILFGDSGQDDPIIYLQIVKEFPGRIKMVFIRDIHDAKAESVQETQQKMKELGVEMKLVKDTLEASQTAVQNAWVLPHDLLDIVVEKEKIELTESKDL